MSKKKNKNTEKERARSNEISTSFTGYYKTVTRLNYMRLLEQLVAFLELVRSSRKYRYDRKIKCFKYYL